MDCCEIRHLLVEIVTANTLHSPCHVLGSRIEECWAKIKWPVDSGVVSEMSVYEKATSRTSEVMPTYKVPIPT